MPTRIDWKKTMLWHVRAKLLKTKNKLLKTLKEQWQITYRINAQRIPDYSSESIETKFAGWAKDRGIFWSAERKKMETKFCIQQKYLSTVKAK